MHNKKTNLILSLSIITAIVVATVFILFFKVIKNKNEHTSAVLTTLETKINKKANIKMLEKKIAELEATRARIDSYFVDSEQIDSFISYLENLGTTAGTVLEVKTVEISPNKKNTILGKVSAQGTFASVMKTITLLESIPYQIEVTSVYLNKDTQTVTSEVKGKTVTTTSYVWQADISFEILSSS
jgi:hypothetical protein